MIELNVERLIRVRDLVVSQPELLNLEGDFVNGIVSEAGELTGHSLCIAGLAALDAGFITLRSTPRPNAPKVFYDVLPIAQARYFEEGPLNMFRAAIGAGVDSFTGDRLMLVPNWPPGFQKQLAAAATPDARAKVTARRIDQFISSGGRL